MPPTEASETRYWSSIPIVPSFATTAVRARPVLVSGNESRAKVRPRSAHLGTETPWEPGIALADWEQYRESYERAFGEEPEVRTDRYKAIAAEAEPTREWLGGPLSLMLAQGTGDVIFQDTERFRGVANAEDFLRLCTSQVDQYRAKISEHEPQDAAEQADQALLLQVADDMEEVCIQAHLIVQKEEEAA